MLLTVQSIFFKMFFAPAFLYNYTIQTNKMHTFKINILIKIFFVSSTCFEPQGLSSGIRLYIRLMSGTFQMLKLQKKKRKMLL